MNFVLRLTVIVVLALWHICAAARGSVLVLNRLDDSVTLVRNPGYEPIITLRTGSEPHEVALSPNGLKAIIANYGRADEQVSGGSGSLSIVDLIELRVVATIDLPAGAHPHGVAWARADTAVATAEGLGELIVIDTDLYSVKDRISLGSKGAHMVVSTRDGLWAWVANPETGTVSRVDLTQNVKVAEVASGAGAEGLSLAHEETQLWVANSKAGTVSVFDAVTLDKLAEITVGALPHRIAADDKRHRVYVSLLGSYQLLVLDSQSREILRRIDYELPPERLADTTDVSAVTDHVPLGMMLSKDNNLIFSAHTRYGWVTVHNANSLEEVAAFPAGRGPDGMIWSWLSLPLIREP